MKDDHFHVDLSRFYKIAYTCKKCPILQNGLQVDELLNVFYFQVLKSLKKYFCTTKLCMFVHQIDPIRFKFIFHLIYDTKVFQILYSIYHRLNGGPFFFIFLLTQVFYLLLCVYINIYIILKLHFERTNFFVNLTMPTPM
jgi:hypothetical protein